MQVVEKFFNNSDEFDPEEVKSYEERQLKKPDGTYDLWVEIMLKDGSFIIKNFTHLDDMDRFLSTLNRPRTQIKILVYPREEK